LFGVCGPYRDIIYGKFGGIQAPDSTFDRYLFGSSNIGGSFTTEKLLASLSMSCGGLDAFQFSVKYLITIEVMYQSSQKAVIEPPQILAWNKL
jgi:hypothetical protein